MQNSRGFESAVPIKRWLDLDTMQPEIDMAIEFNCPYCTAAMRVPDEFSGKTGSCPKCHTKLVVPDVVPKDVPPADVLPIAPVAAKGTTTAPESISPITPVVSPASVPAQIPDPASALPDSLINSSGQPNEAPVFAPTEGQVSVSRKLRRKGRRRKSQSMVMFAVPVVCLILFFAVVALIMNFQQAELKGTLRGTLAKAMKIPTASVSWSEMQLSDADRALAMKALKSAPELFVSTQMTCSISSGANGIAVDVSVGEGHAWFTVNPMNDLTLADWIRDNRVRLNQSRMQRIRDAGSEMFRDKIMKAAGTPVVFAADLYRDDFGLNAHVNAFGSAVEAIAGQKRSFCAHEDRNGILYFALPQSTTSFTIRGRSFGGQPLFPGEYTVTVSGSSSAPPSTAPDKPPADPEATGTEPSDSESTNMGGDADSEMENGEKPNSQADGESMEMQAPKKME